MLPCFAGHDSCHEARPVRKNQPGRGTGDLGEEREERNGTLLPAREFAPTKIPAPAVRHGIRTDPNSEGGLP
jgi:hypothetical protein